MTAPFHRKDEAGAAAPPAEMTREYRGRKFDSGRSVSVADRLTVEEALQINLNQKPFTVTMRTPGDDYFLVRGMLFTERVVTDPAADYEYSETRDPDTGLIIAVNVNLPPALVGRSSRGERSLLSTSSCGICGRKEWLEWELSGEPLRPRGKFAMKCLPALAAQMEAAQPAFSHSGGAHAAAAFTANAELLAVCEDIGRHNAVDKVVGKLLAAGNLRTATCLFISGRASYEIVIKAYRAGIPFLVAVSAPSSLAVDTAEKCGITLIAFCRESRATAYSHLASVSAGEGTCPQT